MGRGLSPEQRAILGLACAVNRVTQDGMLAVKLGQPVNGYRLPTIDWRGPPDLSLRLAVWAIGGYLPDRNTREYRHTPQLKSLKSSLSRATTRLVQRGLIVYTDLPVDVDGYRLSPLGHDYVLTAAGIEAGAAHETQRAQLHVALEAFGMVLPSPDFRAKWPKDNLFWQHFRMKSDAIGRLCHAGNQPPIGYRQFESIGCQPTDVMVNEVPSLNLVNRYGDGEVTTVVSDNKIASRDHVIRYAAGDDSETPHERPA